MKLYYIVIAFVSAILFGVSTPISKYLLTNLNEFQLAGLLYLGAAFGTSSSMFNKNERKNFSSIGKKNNLYILGSILFGGIMGSVLLLFGLGFSKASSVSLWLNLELVATAILGVLFFKDHLNKLTVVGIIITLSAGTLLTYNEGNTGIIAAFFVLLACICWGFDNHFTSLIDGISAKQITFIKGIVAGSVNLIIGIIISQNFPSVKTVLLALVVGSIAYGASIVLYIKSAQNLGATRSQVIFSTAPFFGFISSWIILSEQLGIIQIVSSLLMALAVGMIIKSTHGHEHYHPILVHTHEHTHDDDHHQHSHDGIEPTDKHSHQHKHEETTHEHSHFPDLHHRHDH